MRDRRVSSILVTIGMIASLILPTSVSFAASPKPISSDPKASGTEPVTVEAASASSTIQVAGGPLTITINNELNCDVDHIDDPLHGEFYGETACATLVAVDGTLFGPSFIPAGSSASPLTPFTPVSQSMSGSGSASDPWTITTVVTLGSTGLTLTERDVYVSGAEYYSTLIDLQNAPAAPSHNGIVYRAGDCYLQNDDRGFGTSNLIERSVGCVAATTDVNGNLIPGSRIEQWEPLTYDETQFYEDGYNEVWAWIGTQQPFPNTTPRAGEYIDNGAGLSQVWSLAPGETHPFDSRFTVSPLLVTSQDCSKENVSTVLGVDDLSPPANTPHRVDVVYDPRFLWPTTDADWQTRAQAIVKTIRDRADLTLEEYSNLGFSVPSSVHIKIECNPATLGVAPGEGDGVTDFQFVRLRSSMVRSEFASGQGDPLSYWAWVLDHELYHAVQINQAALFWAIDVTVRQWSGDWVLIESGATLAEDLIADHDDDTSDTTRQSYLNLVNTWMDDPTPIQTGKEDAAYRVGGFLQYLGERFGNQSEPNLERRVAGLLKSAQNQIQWRSSGLEQTITGSIPWFGPDKVYDALRDFYLAAYINAAANPSPDTLIKDQFTRHSGATSGTPVYYDRLRPNSTVLNIGSGPLTFSTPAAGNPTLGAETGRIYEIGLPDQPNQVSLTIKQTGFLPSSLRIGILTTGADGSIHIPPNGRAATEAPFDPGKPFTIPTVGVDKIAVAVIATGKDADYQITATPLTGAAVITLVKPTAAQPSTVSFSTARLALPVWVRPSLDGGATMQGGLHGSAFTATIDGADVPVSSAVEHDTDYRLSLAPGTLAVGAHTVIVRFGGEATAGGTVNVVNDGGNRQIAAAGPLGTLGQGQSATTTATVAATSASAEFNLAWTGSDFDLTLTSPTGRVISETTQATDVQVVQAATSVKIIVTAPTAGVWQINGTGITVAAPEPVTYQVDERDAAIGADVSVGGLNEAGTPLRVRASITDVGTGIPNATVVATIKDGAGVTRRFPLLDDGGHGDGFANDGAYGAVAWATDAAGAYTVSVTAAGKDSAGLAYSRVASTTATLAAKIDADGDGLADAVEAWFGLNPSVADAAIDRDGDGLTLPAELSAGLSPYSADTDEGLETDSSELARGTDPRDMTDDAVLPGVVLTADAIDGSKISVGLATKGQTGQVHLDRIQGTTRVDLGLFPGTHRTIIDGPLAAGAYTYEAYAVAASGARSMPITAGPVTALADATIPFVNLRVNNGNRWTNSGTVVVELTDLTEQVTDMRFATSEAALATAAWLPFRAVTTTSIPATTGLHTIYAQVRDASGLASATATGTVMIDVIAPQSSISTLPGFTNVPSVDAAYTATDADAGVLAVEVWQRYRASSTAAWSAWSLAATGSASPIAVALGLGDGDYEMYSIAVDRAQNRETAPATRDVAITIDRVLPVTQVGPLPATSSGSPPVPFTASDDRSGISTVELWWRYRATSTGTWGAWTLGPSGTTSPIAFAYPSGDGFYEFYSIGIDGAGNRELAPSVADAATERTSTGPVTTTRVSESTTHGQGNGVSDDSYISADGRFVTYRSTASNLVSGDTNGVMDVFVHDRLTETTSRASVDAAGVQGNAQSDDSAISADGRYVVFKSQASNFVTGDTNGTSWDIFRKDLQTGAIVRVSTSSSGAQSNGASHDPVVSADGRYVAFRSSASNLVTGDVNGQQDVFRKDVQTGTTTLVSVSSAGVQGNALADDPQISDDGSRIAFHSDATNLVSGDTNAARDVFVRDITAGTTVRVSVDSSGTQGNGASAEASISGDGTTVAYQSDASNLVASDTNAKTDVFAHVLATGVTSRVSVSATGGQQTKASEEPSLSGDGSIIAFDSLGSSLVSGDTNSRKDIFIKDIATGTVTRMSVDTAGVQGNDTSRNASISGDGSTVAFESDSTNLIANDTNGTQDVFVRGPSLAQ
jgi:hypothetical protein